MKEKTIYIPDNLKEVEEKSITIKELWIWNTNPWGVRHLLNLVTPKCAMSYKAYNCGHGVQRLRISARFLPGHPSYNARYPEAGTCHRISLKEIFGFTID